MFFQHFVCFSCSASNPPNYMILILLARMFVYSMIFLLLLYGHMRVLAHSLARRHHANSFLGNRFPSHSLLKCATMAIVCSVKYKKYENKAKANKRIRTRIRIKIKIKSIKQNIYSDERQRKRKRGRATRARDQNLEAEADVKSAFGNTEHFKCYMNIWNIRKQNAHNLYFYAAFVAIEWQKGNGRKSSRSRSLHYSGACPRHPFRKMLCM